MQYCSLQHQTLLTSPVTSKLGIFFTFSPSLHSFWSYFSTHLQQHIGHLLTWGVSLSVSYLFAFSYWGSTYTEIGKHCKSGLFIHLLIYLHTRYIYVYLSWVTSTPLNHCPTYELSQQDGKCCLGKESVKKWEPSLALTVPRIPKTFQRRFYVGPDPHWCQYLRH